jgi:two-component system, sensor histidine kinase and response regulator
MNGKITDSSILIVDDTQQNVMVLSQMLRDAGYKVFAAFNGEDALKLLEKRKPELILLDVMMPGMNGFQVCEKLKVNPDTQRIPVIFLSALNDIESKVKAFEAGGVDYITKPFQHQEVLARIELHLSVQLLQNERETYISELKSKQEHLERLNQEKDEVLAVISHDMRNPLGGIIGIAELMKSESITDPDEVEELLGLIESSAQRLLALVNDMLDVAVIESNSVRIELKPTDLGNLINEVVRMHQPAAKNKNVLLHVQVTDLPKVMCDDSKLSQVLGNLLSNAIKFTPSKGSITVAASISADNDSSVVINVSDTGIGIPPEFMANLYKKMGGHQRSGTSGEKGTGLGMPIIKRYVEEHKGTIHVASEQGKGTTFTIKLPVSPEIVESVN